MSDYENIKDFIKEGNNIFITGAGGVGKSYYINKLKDDYKDEIVLTSTTGVSSYNLKAMTIHSFTGIGAFKVGDKVHDIVKKMKKYNNYEIVKTRVRKYSILVIDEVSMLGKGLLEAINELLQIVRGNDRIFGGLQVIFTGDFMQLPPVNDQYCFKSSVWKDLNFKVIYLTKLYRFDDDVYAGMLERIRLGKNTVDDNKELYKRFFAYKKHKEEENDSKEDNIRPTFLYSRKMNVNEKNMEELEKNKNEMLIFKAKYSDKHKDCKLDLNKLDNNLYLKIGAQVMLTINFDIDNGMVNGSRGIIKKYEKDSGILTVKFLNGLEVEFVPHEYVFEEDGKVLYKMMQYPFILAYALSIHKVQGCTLDYAIIDIGHSIFEENMSYVALSRVRNLNGLFLQSFQPYKIMASREALEFYENIENLNKNIEPGQ
jgi:ATP-dependent exoDNAse (exonuclease V) alpha subunit